MRLGIDLGGTKIEIIALDNSGKALYRERVATPQGDYAATVQCIVDLVKVCESELGQVGSVGIGIPGALSHKTGLVKNANSVCLIGQDLKGDIESQLERTIYIANDANCFALSEAVDGSAQNATTVFGVIIGTGCGGALVVDKQVLNGANSITGEWGHNPLSWADNDTKLECYCGHKGCIETFLSGTGLENHYHLRGGKPISAKEMVKLAAAGDGLAEQVMQDYIVWLAKGLASVINVFDPDVIVLGGGMSNIQRLYSEVPKIWDHWVFSNEPVLTRLVAPTYGDSSGVRGAAWLAK